MPEGDPIIPDAVVVPETVTAPEADNSVIRQLRETASTSAKALAQTRAEFENMKSQLTELQREKLSESERLRAENADLAKIAEEARTLKETNDRFSGAFQSLYEQELASVPDTQRARIEKLTSSGSFADRLEAIRDAKQLLAPAPKEPLVAGTPSNPSSRVEGSNPKPESVNPKDISWDAAYAPVNPTGRV